MLADNLNCKQRVRHISRGELSAKRMNGWYGGDFPMTGIPLLNFSSASSDGHNFSSGFEVSGR